MLAASKLHSYRRGTGTAHSLEDITRLLQTSQKPYESPFFKDAVNEDDEKRRATISDSGTEDMSPGTKKRLSKFDVDLSSLLQHKLDVDNAPATQSQEILMTAKGNVSKSIYESSLKPIDEDIQNNESYDGIMERSLQETPTSSNEPDHNHNRKAAMFVTHT